MGLCAKKLKLLWLELVEIKLKGAVLIVEATLFEYTEPEIIALLDCCALKLVNAIALLM